MTLVNSSCSWNQFSKYGKTQCRIFVLLSVLSVLVSSVSAGEKDSSSKQNHFLRSNDSRSRELSIKEAERKLQPNPCTNTDTALFELYITLDGSPSEITYNLKCDDGYTYIESPGFGNGDANQEFLERACLPTVTNELGFFKQIGVTCILSVIDKNPSSPFKGSFTAYDDGSAIIQYDGNRAPPFDVFTICVGKGCDSYNPQLPSILEESNPDDDAWMQYDDLHPEFFKCQDVDFTLTFDAKPSDVMYTFECDNVVIWNHPTGSFSQQLAYETIQEKRSCVERKSTCTFTIRDKAGDGLTSSSVGGNKGQYILMYGITAVAKYDGSLNDGTFGEGGGVYSQLSYCFGPKCKERIGSSPKKITSSTPPPPLVQSNPPPPPPVPANPPPSQSPGLSQGTSTVFVVTATKGNN